MLLLSSLSLPVAYQSLLIVYRAMFSYSISINLIKYRSHIKFFLCTYIQFGSIGFTADTEFESIARNQGVIAEKARGGRRLSHQLYRYVIDIEQREVTRCSLVSSKWIHQAIITHRYTENLKTIENPEP